MFYSSRAFTAAALCISNGSDLALTDIVQPCSICIWSTGNSCSNFRGDAGPTSANRFVYISPSAAVPASNVTACCVPNQKRKASAGIRRDFGKGMRLLFGFHFWFVSCWLSVCYFLFLFWVPLWAWFCQKVESCFPVVIITFLQFFFKMIIKLSYFLYYGCRVRHKFNKRLQFFPSFHFHFHFHSVNNFLYSCICLRVTWHPDAFKTDHYCKRDDQKHTYNNILI